MPVVDANIAIHKLHVDPTHRPIGRNMEIYVDDMLVKRKKQGENLENLEETLMKLREIQLRINREKFISRSEDKNLSFFQKLRQASQEEFTWDEECSKAFEELKVYLGSPKILT
ncbi:hypothetical protein LIER_19444 [Lithospermum erythrorhizon]|uniref:Reverse transcriptase domain-containing protein n=1 Tax=Lithospermum erythrorhizon TaxID=34254 RepID=A0AAV3QIN5_LITER